jgi:RimJ/RimL family protein N-acetyltransferase
MSSIKFPFDQSIVLQDDSAFLRPLAYSDIDELLTYLSNEPSLFQYSLQHMRDRIDLEKYVSHALEQRRNKSEYPFVIIDKKSGKIAGTTRLYLINESHAWLAIGYTWIGTIYQRTGLNRSVKLLLLNYCFDELGFIRVEFRIDKENSQSARALESIGAVKEGELRSHMYRKDGQRRNTLIYSILKGELRSKPSS